jgi:hypothetical protein
MFESKWIPHTVILIGILILFNEKHLLWLSVYLGIGIFIRFCMPMWGESDLANIHICSFYMQDAWFVSNASWFILRSYIGWQKIEGYPRGISLSDTCSVCFHYFQIHIAFIFCNGPKISHYVTLSLMKGLAVIFLIRKHTLYCTLKRALDIL